MFRKKPTFKAWQQVAEVYLAVSEIEDGRYGAPGRDIVRCGRRIDSRQVVFTAEPGSFKTGDQVRVTICRPDSEERNDDQ